MFILTLILIYFSFSFFFNNNLDLYIMCLCILAQLIIFGWQINVIRLLYNKLLNTSMDWPKYYNLLPSNYKKELEIIKSEEDPQIIKMYIDIHTHTAKTMFYLNLIYLSMFIFFIYTFKIFYF